MAPWLDDARRAAPADAGADAGLVEIRLCWTCASWGAPSAAGRSATVVRLEVVGLGAVWSGARPGAPHGRAGAAPRRDDALDDAPLDSLRHLPLRLDPVRLVQVAPPGAGALETVQVLPAPDTTLLALLTALFDEFSCYGSPEARDRDWAERRREAEAPGDGDTLTLQPLREAREARRQGSA